MDIESIKAYAEQQIAEAKTNDVDTQVKLQQLWLQAEQTEALQVMAGSLIEMEERGKPAVEIKKIGEVYVDSGSVWIGDPCYFWQHDDETSSVQKQIGSWQVASEKFLGTPYPHRYNFNGLGLMASTGMGDGIYPIYAEIENETIKRITIDFLVDGDDDEEEDEG